MDEKSLQQKGLQCVNLAVIGAGPHALSLVAKLLEPRIDPLEEIPSNTSLFKVNKSGVVKARFEQEPPAKLATSKDSDLRRFEKVARTKAQAKKRSDILKQCFVADPHGCWLAQWERQFRALNIPFLRSPLTAHPDPIDSEMMRLFAETNKRRAKDTVELELNRMDQYHGPYQVPTTTLFHDFCYSIIKRYDLKDTVHPAKVTRLIPIKAPDASPGDCKPWFEVHLDTGKRILAKSVVVAIGGLNRAAMPEWASAARERFATIPKAMQSLLHSNDGIARYSPCKDDNGQLGDKQNRPPLLVVGGGLTAGHLALRVLRSEPDVRVVIASRRDIVERQFDLELKWMGIKRDNQLAKFWGLQGMKDRSTILKQSKNGGSMTPEVLSELREFHARGQLEFMSSTEPIDVNWENLQSEWRVNFDSGEERTFRGIWCATGTILDFNTDELFKDLRQYCDSLGESIQVEGGLPVLTSDLRLSERLNVFVTGAYAALQVGPGALNLMGGKAAACRIANVLDIASRDPTQGWRARRENQGPNRRKKKL